LIAPTLQRLLIFQLPKLMFFLLLRSCQRINPGLRRFETIRNKLLFLRWRVVSPTFNPQSGGPPLAGCPRLLVKYIRSYPPILY
jgi:hypothetical protein